MLSSTVRVLIRLTTTTPSDRMTLHAYAEGVEGIRAIGAGLQAVFLRLCEFLTRFILLSVTHTCRLYGDEQIRVVVTVDEYLMLGASLEHTVDQLVFLDMVPRIADVFLTDGPLMTAEHALDE